MYLKRRSFLHRITKVTFRCIMLYISSSIVSVLWYIDTSVACTLLSASVAQW